MNKNRIRGRHGVMSWHNTAKSTGLLVEVNAAVVQESNAFLPGEILTGTSSKEVSRRHSIEGMNRGAQRCSLKHRNPQA